jgi:hypothetical protein
MKLHTVFDFERLEMVVIGRDGRRYSADEYERFRRDAEAGDEAAKAEVANFDMTADFADRDPREVMQQLVHDCPQCQALRAMGIPTPVDMQQLPHEPFGMKRERDKPRKLRWREQRKRRA